MNDFEGLLSGDFGFKPQGKSAPMAPPKSPPNPNFDFDIGDTKTTSSHPKSSVDFTSSANLDSIFSGSAPKFSSMPAYDKPVYDDEMSSGSANLEDIFSSSKKKNDGFDDLLGGLGRKEPQIKVSDGSGSRRGDKGFSSFDDLLPGFGVSGAERERTSSDGSWPQKSASDATKRPSSIVDDPFVVLESTSPPASSSSGLYNDPLEQFSSLNSSSSKKVDSSATGGVFDDLDPLDGLGKSIPSFSKERDSMKDSSPVSVSPRVSASERSAKSPDKASDQKMPMDDYRESPHSVFEMPSVSADTHQFVPNVSFPAFSSVSFKETKSPGFASPRSEEKMESSDDVWLTVSEIPLLTQPTSAPPPSRPPPPRPARYSRAESFVAANATDKVNEYSSFPSVQSPKSASAGVRNSVASPIDELEEFAMGSQSNVEGSSDVLSSEDGDTNSVAAASAAAMKEAMDRAEAKFRHAREVREREYAKAARNRDSVVVEKEDRSMQDAQEKEFREKQERLEREWQQREREKDERRQREEEERKRIEERERTRQIEREREEKERERRRIERERELARQAVERATREARERAAVEARTRAERAAVGKAQAEARERAGRAAVQRAQAEARERAAAEARERAEKAAAEKAKAEAKEKEARERAAAAARGNQQKNENDLESFFGMGSRPSSAPRPRSNSSDPYDAMFQSKPASETARTSVNTSSSMRKASSSTNIVDDLSSIFGAPTSSGNFQEVEGESEERRRARLERHQRTQERAGKALAEKNARDLEAQREQAERHRIAETLDAEIKRWAAGKEGNLRALLSTLQYVLWPECGWQPVSLTDLITGAAVKKVYRKATLCIHPDKVQQKGATLQQKYIAEKVFDLLKEAWNKFNSEELF